MSGATGWRLTYSLAVAGLLLASVAVPAFAQTQGDAIPAHPRDLVFDALQFDPPDQATHRHVLSNGAIAFVVPDHALPLVTVSVVVRTGSWLEPPEKAGLASLTGGQMRAGGAGAIKRPPAVGRNSHADDGTPDESADPVPGPAEA